MLSFCIGDNMKKYKNYLIVFFLPIIIFLIGLLLNKIYPFGSKILLSLDGYNQYPGFLNNFIKSLTTSKSLFYSFNGLLGFNSYASYVYYTFNITNLIYLLFKGHVIEFYTFIIIIKTGLASLSMYTLLNYLKKDKNNILFSITYGLTTYYLLYYLNYMWFDSIILLPIVTLGIEKLFKENKYLTYLISLSIAIISNFYIGYMICIFSVTYFIYKLINDKCNKKIIITYILSSLAAGLISSFVLIPAILELLNGKSTLFTNYIDDYFKFDLDALNVFYKLTIGSFLNGDLEYGTPNIYVTIFIYLNAFLYFLNNKIKLKEKITNLIILLFFLLSMSFNLLDYFWQMMQMPIWYPVRYAFIFDFFLILLAFKNYQNYEKLSLKKIIIVILTIITLIVIGFFTSGNLNDPINITPKIIYLVISIMFLLYYIFMQNSDYFKKYLIIVLIVELIANTFVTIRNAGNTNIKEDFKINYQNNTEILNKINDQDNFYKITFDDKTIKNNGLLIDYNDINLFSSLRNQKVYTMINKVFGMLTIDDCNTNYYYNNPLVNSLFNIKYYITKDNIDYYKLIDNYNGYNIYQNNDVTSIGFTTTKEILNLKITDNYITNINNLVKTINQDDKDIIKEYFPYDKNTSCTKDVCLTNNPPALIKFKFKATSKSFVYIQNNYPTGKDKTNYTIKVNDKEIGSSNKHPYLINKNDTVEIIANPTNNDFKDYDYHIYEVNYDTYQTFIKNINKNKLEITNYKNDSYFETTIDVKEDTLLFTTIASDKGWKVYVDNKETKIDQIYDGLIGLNLTQGKHQITFKYTVPGLKIGSIITLTTILTVTLITYKKKSKK